MRRKKSSFLGFPFTIKDPLRLKNLDPPSGNLAARAFKNEVLPDPVGPMIAINSPDFAVPLRPLSIQRLEYAVFINFEFLGSLT